MLLFLIGNLPAAENDVNAVDRSWADRLEFVGIAVTEPEYHVWGSSPVIGPDGKIHLFVARWPVSAKFAGWATDCEIAHYVSEKPEGPFSFKGVVLQGTGTSTWDKASPHNPTIQQIGAQYVLLYIANTGRDFPASQRIGMAIAKSLAGPWKKVGTDGLILSPPEAAAIWSRNSTVGVNNPALLQHPDGRFFLYYKAMKAVGVRRMGVAIAEKLEGPYGFHETPLTSNTRTIEDGYAFFEDGRIHLLTTDNDHGSGLLWTSDDGLHFGAPILGFDKMNHYIAQEKLDAATNYRGKKFERPQVLVQNGHPTYLYVASGANISKGRGSCSYVLRIKAKPSANPPNVGSDK